MGGGGSSRNSSDGDGDSRGTRGADKGHSADILAIAHCGHQQVKMSPPTGAKRHLLLPCNSSTDLQTSASG